MTINDLGSTIFDRRSLLDTTDQLLVKNNKIDHD